MISRGYLYAPGIIVGVDTHKDKQVAVVVDKLGVRIGQHNLPTTNMGYVSLERWASGLGKINAFGPSITLKYLAYPPLAYSVRYFKYFTISTLKSRLQGFFHSTS